MARNLFSRHWFSTSAEVILAIPSSTHHVLFTTMLFPPWDLVVAMVKNGFRPKCMKIESKLHISSIKKANRELSRKTYTQNATADRLVQSVPSLVGAYWLAKAKLVEILCYFFEKSKIKLPKRAGYPSSYIPENSKKQGVFLNTVGGCDPPVDVLLLHIWFC